MNTLKIYTIKGILFMLLALVAMSLVSPIYAGTPTEPHGPDSMWVEPSAVTYSPANASIGTKFNVTVWLNIASDKVFGYQVALLYNRTQLRGVSAGFTEGSTSQFMEGHSTQTTGPIIDTSYLGNGSVLAFESCKGDDFIPAPKAGSLIWVEFEILIMPPEGQTYTSIFDITTNYPAKTWVQNLDLIKIDITTYDGTYDVIPELSPLLMLPIFLILTLITIALNKKLLRNPKFKWKSN